MGVFRVVGVGVDVGLGGFGFERWEWGGVSGRSGFEEGLRHVDVVWELIVVVVVVVIFVFVVVVVLAAGGVEDRGLGQWRKAKETKEVDCCCSRPIFYGE